MVLRIQRDLGLTLLIVTHDMAEACALATRVGVLDAGALVACDTPAALAQSSDARVRHLFDAVTTPGPR